MAHKVIEELTPSHNYSEERSKYNSYSQSRAKWPENISKAKNKRD
jgi:hypothetical protein